jgi:hypothetical protein
MKKLILLIFLVGCTLHMEDSHGPCGYHETPYYQAPYMCEESPTPHYVGECCTWYVEDYYSECREVWCYSEYTCAWQLYDWDCYPI